MRIAPRSSDRRCRPDAPARASVFMIGLTPSSGRKDWSVRTVEAVSDTSTSPTRASTDPRKIAPRPDSSRTAQPAAKKRTSDGARNRSARGKSGYQPAAEAITTNAAGSVSRSALSHATRNRLTMPTAINSAAAAAAANAKPAPRSLV